MRTNLTQRCGPIKRRAAAARTLRSTAVRRALPFVLLTALLVPATATADDAAVESAYNAHKGELARAVKAYVRAARS